MITWTPVIDGDDLVIGSFSNPVTASWFGGPDDSLDDGQSASGVDNTKMGVQGCSVPMYIDANGGKVLGCLGSPLGPIPWQTPIIVNAIVRGAAGAPIVSTQVTVPLIDVGPAVVYRGISLNRPLDLCPSTFLALGGDLKLGLIHVFFRIIGGAKYLKA
jgi:hypothetical protein